MNKRFLQLYTCIMILLSVSCQHKHFGYLSKVKVKKRQRIELGENPNQLISKQICFLYQTKRVIPTKITQNYSYPIKSNANEKEANGVKPVSLKLNKEINILNQAPLQTKEDFVKDPTPNQPFQIDNTDAVMAILFAIMHFASILLADALLVNGFNNEWVEFFGYFLVTGFSTIITTFAIKGMKSFFKNPKRRGLLISFFALVYGLAFLILFIILLFLLFTGDWF
jgi:hypothetical protein